ncbi:hypothetical protein BJY04DRAFT_194472 [Aspergillus karnatakaensis]|uniref:uncharacterized protein n=1 Tax=Aspergillus karnatakaensis TaxID=1810916 RepID=UPI003CCD0C44
MRNRAWVEQAFTDIGFDQGTPIGEQSLSTRACRILWGGKHAEGYQCPLIALALAYCFRVQNLAIHVWPEATDPWLRRIVDYTLGTPGYAAFFTLNDRPLRRLRTLQAGPKLIRQRNSLHYSRDPFEITDVKLPFHRFTWLQEVMFQHVSVGANVAATPNTANNTTQIERLTLSGPIYDQLQLPTWGYPLSAPPTAQFPPSRR